MVLSRLNSLKFQIGIPLLFLFLILAGSLGYTIYSLKLRQHDYLILNHIGQLQVIANNLTEQSRNYVKQAPDNYDKYNRDLETYWQILQKQTHHFNKIITELNSRELSSGLTGHEETIYCNYDNHSQNQLNSSLKYWIIFNNGLAQKIGNDLENPRLTWGAEFIAEHGDALVESTQLLAIAFQKMMEGKLNNVRLFQWITVKIGLIAIILVFFVLQRRVIRPLNATVNGFKKVAQGDFNHQVPVLTQNELGQMAIALNHLLDRLNSIFRLTDRINQGKKLDEMLAFIHEEFQTFVPLDWVGVFFTSADGKRMVLERCYCESTPPINDGDVFIIKESNFEKVLKNNLPIPADFNDIAIEALEKKFAKEGLQSALYLSLNIANSDSVVMVFASAKQSYSSEHIEFLNNIAATVSHVLEKTVVVENLVSAAINGLAKLAESRDPETGDHLTRMALYSAIIAEELARKGEYTGLITPQYVRDVYNFAPMHDIGKVGISDDILLKPGRLDAKERQEMERHPTIGAEVLQKAEQQMQAMGHSIFTIGIEIAECHHEKFDGSGYPKQLKQSDIPLSARIVAAADVFDALTSKRPYKDAWPIEKALELMQKESGKHFDPEVIAAMLRALPAMTEIYDRLKHV
jgi:response regulator RpfG family c-di-GMP phosphodiesterase/HAMP domain-containing protein